MRTFEITGAMIAQLTDSQLRELLRRIGHAELRTHQIASPAVLLAGGHQNAADGGVDVRLEKLPRNVELAFLRRREAILQSKAELMRAADITKEMRPKGALRPAIARVIRAGGAYLIASSLEDLSDSMLKVRRDAMVAALGKTRRGRGALVDFYDRKRLALYANEHVSVAIWVRDTLGYPTFGWQGLGNWSGSRAPGAYAIDEHARVRRLSNDRVLPVTEALEALRAALTPGRAARLTGHSGTGKTRLAEALFDRESDPDVVYANCGEALSPTPTELLRRLVAEKRRIVVVLDNCPLELHVLCAPLVTDTAISLLTIEADIEAAASGDTASFQLAPASGVVVGQILRAAAPHLSPLSRERIVDFADGNARVALALARRVAATEDISGLHEEDLVRRLLRTGTRNDSGLEHVAEICALVYSFDVSEGSAELSCLAKIAELSTVAMRRQVARLAQHELLQSRGDKRALLPQALAHRLAPRALEGLALTKLRRRIQKANDGRLANSFARRLGFLPDSPAARRLAAAWVDELLADPDQIPEHGPKLVRRLAPLVAEKVFAGLERLAASAAVADRRNGERWADLLRHLAYRAEDFDRAVEVLIALDRRAPRNTSGPSSPLRSALRGLFGYTLSGTLAPPGQRAAIVRRLLTGDDDHSVDLGIDLAAAMLEPGAGSTGFNPSFGAEPRSFGWSSRTHRPWEWYEQALSLLNAPVARVIRLRLRAALASRFQRLVAAGYDPLLIAAATTIAREGVWFDGWIAVGNTLRFLPTLAPARRRALEQLRRRLAPTSLDDKLEAYFRTEGFRRAFATTAARAKAVRALAAGLMTEGRPLGPRLAGCHHARELGEALARAARDVPALWTELVAAFKAQPAPRDARLLAGVLKQLREIDPDAAEDCLDVALADPALLPEMVTLQCDDGLGVRGADRLLRTARDPSVDVAEFRYAANALSQSTVPARSVAKLVAAIADREGAAPHIAFEVLQLRLMDRPPEPEVAAAARALFAAIDLDAVADADIDYLLSDVAGKALGGAEGATCAQGLLEQLLALAERGLWSPRFEGLAQALSRLHPSLGLDVFFGRRELADHDEGYLTWNLREWEPLRDVSDEAIATWVAVDAPRRAAQVARVMPMLATDADGVVAFTPLAKRLRGLVGPNPQAYFGALRRHFNVEDGQGMRSSELESIRTFARALAEGPDGALAAWARRVEAEIATDIKYWAAHERADVQQFEHD